MPIPSLSTFFGVIAGVGIVFWGISGATTNFMLYVNFPSFAIVFGGTLTSAFIGFRWRYIYWSILAALKVFIRQSITPKSLARDVGMIIDWSRRVQKEGVAAWDAIAQETKDPYVTYVASLLTTGYSPKEVTAFAETTIEENYFRHLNEPNILLSMAGAAPAFGMIGTLIGLVAMLSKMEDPSKIGPGLSVALMTTLYGVLAARFIFLPCSTKAKQLLGINRFREYLLLEGINLILEKRSPFYIQDRMNSFLDRKMQFSLEKHDAGQK